MSDSSAGEAKTRTVIVDLGKKKRRQVKKLSKGKGKLADRVQGLVEKMRAEGEVSGGDAVVVIVQKKARKMNFFKS